MEQCILMLLIKVSVIFNVLLAVSDHEGGLYCAGLAEVPACALNI